MTVNGMDYCADPMFALEIDLCCGFIFHEPTVGFSGAKVVEEAASAS
jgi:hypothetical protein